MLRQDSASCDRRVNDHKVDDAIWTCAAPELYAARTAPSQYAAVLLYLLAVGMKQGGNQEVITS